MISDECNERNVRDESFGESVEKVGQVRSLVSSELVRNARLNSPIACRPSN